MKRNFLDSNEGCDDYYKDGGMGACGEDFDETCECVELPGHLDIRFYKCNVCGQIIARIGDKGNPLTCCMRDMELLVPDTVEASAEHHIPVFKKHGHKVKICVGDVPHPMTSDHHIEWICMVTDRNIYWTDVSKCEEATACFRIESGECVAAVYAYCNLHRLWKCC